jgi:transposase InsO family protein
MAPGPKKKAIVDVRELAEQIRALEHRAKRTRGSGALYAAVNDQVSRRDFQAQVRQARKQVNRERRAAVKHVEWNRPGVAWAIDDTELGIRDWRSGQKLYLNTLFDPAARYVLESLMGYLATGERIAAHLERLFKRHGAPLILKRDNASNLNHEAVDRLLRDYLVIPLNSPLNYPRYNGGIERAQREVKQELSGRLSGPQTSMGRLVQETQRGRSMSSTTSRE